MPAEPKQDNEDFAARTRKILVAAMSFKAAIKARGRTFGTGKCPFCPNGRWHGRLAGSKQHLHLACDGCDVQLME